VPSSDALLLATASLTFKLLFNFQRDGLNDRRSDDALVRHQVFPRHFNERAWIAPGNRQNLAYRVTDWFPVDWRG
jgi:hypothetical protein